MSVRGFFYNSVNKDRMYNGQDMNEDKAPFYKEGVCFGQLAVTSDGSSMTVNVDGGAKTGYAFMNHHTIHNTTVLPLLVSQAGGTLPRIDRVILQNDEMERKPDIFIRQGEYASKPQAPQLVNNDVIQEKCLAEIYVAAGAVKITQKDITDTRADTGLCGFIASQFQDIDFEQIQRQFDKYFADFKEENLLEFMEWFETIKNVLESAQNGDLLMKLKELYENLYSVAMEKDIDNIINNLYKEEDEASSIFNTATYDDIENIIKGSYEEQEEENIDYKNIDEIIQKLFQEETI